MTAAQAITPGATRGEVADLIGRLDHLYSGMLSRPDIDLAEVLGSVVPGLTKVREVRVPKGVVVAHQSVVNLFHSHRETLYAPAIETAGRRHLRAGHAWSFFFDASWQPQLWLLDGHCVHVVSEEVRRDPELLARAVVEHGFDFLEVTPSFFAQMADSGLLDGDVGRVITEEGVGSIPRPLPEERAVRASGEIPDVGLARLEEDLAFAAFRDAVDLALRGGAREHGAVRGDRVPRLDQEPVEPVADDIGDAADAIRHHGRARRERLDGAHWRSLVHGR